MSRRETPTWEYRKETDRWYYEDSTYGHGHVDRANSRRWHAVGLEDDAILRTLKEAREFVEKQYKDSLKKGRKRRGRR